MPNLNEVLNTYLQYIGARYVPKFFENPDDLSNNWKSGVMYEALTIVTYNNDSYTSKIVVPDNIGNPSDNPKYWACTTKYTAALAALQNSVGVLNSEVDGIELLTDNYVTPEQFGAVGDGVTDDSQAFTDAFATGKTVMANGTYKITNITVPDEQTLYLEDFTTINVIGSITLGTKSVLNGLNATIYTTTNSEHSLVKLGYNSKVILFRISGLNINTEEIGDYPKGNGNYVTAIEAVKTDFVECEVRIMDDLKNAYTINGGTGGADYTINDSKFIAQWIADVQIAFNQIGSSNTFIYTSAYIESSAVGYSINDSFYGEHHIHFDNVTKYFNITNIAWGARLGDVFIPRLSTASLLANRESSDRFFFTRFHCYDANIVTKNVHEPNIISDPLSSIFMKSDNAHLRLTGGNGITTEGKYSNNDTSDGITAGLGAGGKFTIERDSDSLLLLTVDALGNTYIRQTTTVGDGDNYTHINIPKGGLQIGKTETDTNIPTHSFFVNASWQPCYKDGSGTVHVLAYA